MEIQTDSVGRTILWIVEKAKLHALRTRQSKVARRTATFIEFLDAIGDCGGLDVCGHRRVRRAEQQTVLLLSLLEWSLCDRGRAELELLLVGECVLGGFLNLCRGTSERS